MRGASPVDHKLGGAHISGAERIISSEALKSNVIDLIDRALTHNKGESDFINISIQKIHDESQINYISPLKIKNFYLREDINPKDILSLIGFNENQITYTLNLLFKLKNLRGALIVSYPDLHEFWSDVVRCTNMDYAPHIKEDLDSFLDKHNSSGKYLKDALCLSSKICSDENVICEICISDDKNYLTGYISSRSLGYIRIKNFKPSNHEYGGRIIFIKDKNKLSNTINYLKNSIVLIESIPKIL